MQPSRSSAFAPGTPYHVFGSPLKENEAKYHNNKPTDGEISKQNAIKRIKFNTKLYKVQKYTSGKEGAKTLLMQNITNRQFKI